MKKKKKDLYLPALFFLIFAGIGAIFLIRELFAPSEKIAGADEKQSSGGFYAGGELPAEASEDIAGYGSIKNNGEDGDSKGLTGSEGDAPVRKTIEPDAAVVNALLVGDQDMIDRAMLSQYQRINPETKGIIRIRNTVLNHPLMQSPAKEDYYLTHDVLKQKNGNGTPFLTLASDLSKSSGNNVIYGHNIRYGRKDIFEPLSGYEKLEFYKEHPTVEIVTEEGTVSYLVFAYYLIDTADEDVFPYWISPAWTDESEFEEYMAEVEKRNWLDTRIPCSISDRYITLSACSVELAHSGTNRMVVMARKERDGEYPILYSEKACMKSNPYLPQKLRKD